MGTLGGRFSSELCKFDFGTTITSMSERFPTAGQVNMSRIVLIDEISMLFGFTFEINKYIIFFHNHD